MGRLGAGSVEVWGGGGPFFFSSFFFFLFSSLLFFLVRLAISAADLTCRPRSRDSQVNAGNDGGPGSTSRQFRRGWQSELFGEGM